MEKTLTIFTPTYNRAYILPQLYKSLCAQTNHDFLWLIIDDGSTDATEEMVRKWMEENFIEITYQYQENAGKMAAYNTALALTVTPLFMCVDSDDSLVVDAVNAIAETYRLTRKLENLSGLVSYRGRADGSVLGTVFPNNLEQSPLSKLYEAGFEGDTTLVFKTAIAKRFPFPTLPGEKFISEMYVYNQIDEKYDLKLLRKVLTICNYLEDGYTRNGYPLVKNNPMGWALIYQQKKASASTRRKRFKYAAYGGSYVLMSSKEARKAAWERGLYHIGMVDAIAAPASLLLYLRRKWVHRNE